MIHARGDTLTFGLGIVGGVLTMTSYQSDFGYTDKTTVSAVMVSLQNAGAFLSAVSCFPISERLGRQRTIQGAMTIFCIGVLLQVVPSHSLACFYIGRFVAGIGLGCGTATVPMYNAEVAPKEIRGMVGSGVQLLFTLGVMISYWVTYGTTVGLPVSAAQWQIPVGLQMVPAGVLALGLFTQKESPRWLAKKGRFEEAWDALTWFRADDGTHSRILAACLGDMANSMLIKARRWRLTSMRSRSVSKLRCWQRKASGSVSFSSQRIDTACSWPSSCSLHSNVLECEC